MEPSVSAELEVQICPVIELFNEFKKTDIADQQHLVREEKYDVNAALSSVYYFHHHQV